MTQHLKSVDLAGTPPKGFVPLREEQREAVNTPLAAWHLGRQKQTMRGWACFGEGPIAPVRVNGRLMWRVEDIRRLLGVA